MYGPGNRNNLSPSGFFSNGSFFKENNFRIHRYHQVENTEDHTDYIIGTKNCNRSINQQRSGQEPIVEKNRELIMCRFPTKLKRKIKARSFHYVILNVYLPFSRRTSRTL